MVDCPMVVFTAWYVRDPLVSLSCRVRHPYGWLIRRAGVSRNMGTDPSCLPVPTIRAVTQLWTYQSRMFGVLRGWPPLQLLQSGRRW